MDIRMLVEGVPVEVPFDVTVALMCDRFKRLPSELAAEDAAGMLRVWNILAAIDEARGEQHNGRL